MSSDNYNFHRSTVPQSIDGATPFSKLDYAYVQDLNNGVYSNGGSATLVQFDLSSIYSNSMIDPSLFYLTIPLTYVCTYQTNAASAFVAPQPSSWAQCSLKPNFMNLIHSVQFEMDGKTIEQNTPFQGMIQSIRQMATMSKDDLTNFGSSIGIGSVTDNPFSLRYNSTASALPNSALAGSSGNGIVNNAVFPSPILTSSYGQQSNVGPQGTNTYNNGLQDRTNSLLASSASQYSSIAVLEPQQNINLENANYSVVVGNYQIWYETAVIRLKDILGSFDSLCLLKRFNGKLNIYINTGSFAVATWIPAATAGTAGNGYYPQYNLSGSNTTFTNTCPLMLNSLPFEAYNNVSATITNITCGLFIANATTTTVSTGTVTASNLALSGAATQIRNCRIYYPLVKLKEVELGKYIQENTAKTIVYSAFLQNLISNVSNNNGNVSQLIQSGVRAIKTIFIIPFISASSGTGGLGYGNYGQSSYFNGLAGASTVATAGNTTTPFSPLLSPFCAAPTETGPLSITNINIQIGGQNVQQYLLNYGWQEFLQEVVEYNKINSGDMGISNGLFNYDLWNKAMRVYVIDCSRVENVENAVPRNIVVQFQNNSSVNCDYYIFTEYLDSFVINVQTGLVTK